MPTPGSLTSRYPLQVAQLARDTMLFRWNGEIQLLVIGEHAATNWYWLHSAHEERMLADPLGFLGFAERWFALRGFETRLGVNDSLPPLLRLTSRLLLRVMLLSQRKELAAMTPAARIEGKD